MPELSTLLAKYPGPTAGEVEDNPEKYPEEAAMLRNAAQSLAEAASQAVFRIDDADETFSGNVSAFEGSIEKLRERHVDPYLRFLRGNTVKQAQLLGLQDNPFLAAMQVQERLLLKEQVERLTGLVPYVEELRRTAEAIAALPVRWEPPGFSVLTRPLMSDLGAVARAATEGIMAFVRSSERWLEPGTPWGDMFLLIRDPGQPEALEAAKRIAKRLDWQPNTRKAGGVAAMIGLKARAAATGATLEQAKTNVLTAALIEAAQDARKTQLDDDGVIFVPYSDLGAGHCQRWMVERAIAIAERDLLEQEVTTSGLLILDSRLSLPGRKGRRPWTGTWESPEHFRSVIGSIVRKLREQGKNPTTTTVLNYVSLHTNYGAVDKAQFTRWYQRAGFPTWEDFLKIVN